MLCFNTKERETQYIENYLLPVEPHGKGSILEGIPWLSSGSDSSLSLWRARGSVPGLETRILPGVEKKKKKKAIERDIMKEKSLLENSLRRVKSFQLCLTLCDTLDCSAPGSFVHGIDSPGENTGVGCHALF